MSINLKLQPHITKHASVSEHCAFCGSGVSRRRSKFKCQTRSVHLLARTQKDKLSSLWFKWHNVRMLVKETRPLDSASRPAHFEASTNASIISPLVSDEFERPDTAHYLSPSVEKELSQTILDDKIRPIPSSNASNTVEQHHKRSRRRIVYNLIVLDLKVYIVKNSWGNLVFIDISGASLCSSSKPLLFWILAR